MEETTEPIPVATDKMVDDTLFSQNVFYNYPMKIFIPKEYEDDKNLPIVYLLDGLLAGPVDGVVFFDNVVASLKNVGLKAILVAVGDKTNVSREIDFLAAGCFGSNQGFGNFFNFITKELVPYIDGKYESDQSKRTLIGFSHGGNFAYNAFFRENPNNIIFHGYISVDPSKCDSETIKGHLDNMQFSENTNLKIHFSQATSDVEPIYNLIAERDFPWLISDFQDYPNDTHTSVITPAIRKGLRFIYN